MWKLGWVFVFIPVFAAGCTEAGAQAGACVTDCPVVQYVGNSSLAYRGNQGIYQYYSVCQGDYGPNHRLCTQDEIWFTVDIPRLEPGTAAWFGNGCDGWKTIGSGDADCPRGDLVNEYGQLTSACCSEQHPIACCGPR